MRRYPRRSRNSTHSRKQCEKQFPLRDGKGIVTADVVIIKPDNTQIAIEIKTHNLIADRNTEERQVEKDKGKSKYQAAFKQYGHPPDEAKFLTQRWDRPEKVIPVIISSTGQIEEQSKRWLRQLLTELCPAPILKGKIRDPLWNPTRFLRRIAISATILSAGRILSALGISHNLSCWYRF